MVIVMYTKYQSKHVQKLFSISAESVRAWAIEFEKYLSPNANPGSGRHRNFTDADLSVFALVKEMKAKGNTYEDIHGSLENDQRGAVPQLATGDVRDLVLSEQGLALAFRVEELTQKVDTLEHELGEARLKLRATEDTNVRLTERDDQHKKRIEELEQEVKASREEIKQMAKEAGHEYARGMMDALRQRGDLPKYTDDPTSET
jgi:DNA-binding transcriptional MerR regulator